MHKLELFMYSAQEGEHDAARVSVSVFGRVGRRVVGSPMRLPFSVFFRALCCFPAVLRLRRGSFFTRFRTFLRARLGSRLHSRAVLHSAQGFICPCRQLAIGTLTDGS